MFRFAHPEYLMGLYFLPVIVAAAWYLFSRRKKALVKFADRELHNVLLPTYSSKKYWVKTIIWLTALALLIIAAANPQVGTRLEEVKQTGIDVFILLDVSTSMMAEDIKPNRLEKAKYQISNLVNKLRGDRIGLIIFSGEAFVQFPLTTDYAAANLFLSAVDFTSIPTQGTAISPAIDLAVKSFDAKASTQKVIVIITDGEDHEGNIKESVDQAVEKDITFYTIGLGSSAGVPIPLYLNGKQTGFKTDREGKVVLTRLDDKILKEIASEGKGKYFHGSNYEDQLDMIYSDLSQLEKTEFGVKKVTDYEDRFYYFLIPAIILLIIEFMMSQRKSPLITRVNKRLGLEQ
jgi:Ca-activated chloride channel family protein